MLKNNKKRDKWEFAVLIFKIFLFVLFILFASANIFFINRERIGLVLTTIGVTLGILIGVFIIICILVKKFYKEDK